MNLHSAGIEYKPCDIILALHVMAHYLAIYLPDADEGVYIGLQLVEFVTPTGIQLTIAIGILLTLFIKAPATSDHARYPKSIYYFVGLFIGAANVLVGVLSPLLGAILRLEPLNRTTCRDTWIFGFAGNLYKIIGFSFISFAFFEYLPLIVSASIATIISSILGKTLLGKIS